jgi:hypothetical protein
VAGFSYRRFQLGLAGWLAIHAFSNPNLSSLTLWVGMGGLLGLQAWQRKMERSISPAPVPTQAVTIGPPPRLQASV